MSQILIINIIFVCNVNNIGLTKSTTTTTTSVAVITCIQSHAFVMLCRVIVYSYIQGGSNMTRTICV